ncbi:MAG TPA: lamin tail domain-containing protein [Candidatus Limnocylindrales bacterium]
MSSRLRSAGPSLLAACLTLTLASGLVRAAPSGPTTAAVAWPPSGGLLLSEVMTGGASASDEFIELDNASSDPLDLVGDEVVYVSASGGTVTRKASWTAASPLVPGQHLLVANGAGVYAVGADATYTGGLAATGGAVALRAADGSVLDAIAWGNATNGFIEGTTASAPPAGSSLERLPGGAAGNGVDTNDDSFDWFIQPDPDPQALVDPPVPGSPSPTATPTVTPIEPTPTITQPTPAPTDAPTATPTAEPTETPTAMPPPTLAPTPAAPTATPVDPTPTASPAQATATIASARSAAPGTAVVIEGVLTTPLGLTDGGQGAFVQDATAGIALYLSGDGWPALPTGTAVRLAGTTDARYGQATVRVTDHAQLVPLGPAAAPAPLGLPTGDAGEAAEGLLVTTSGTVTTTPEALADGFALLVDDGSGALRVVAGAATGISREALRRGSTVALTGVLGQHASSGTTGGYRLYLRSPSDVVAAVSSPSPIPSASGPRPSSSGDVVSPIAAVTQTGQRATVEGVVTSGAMLWGVDQRRFTLQDASGAILVRVPAGVRLPTVGRSVRVSGTVGHYLGAPELGAAAPPVALASGTAAVAHPIAHAPLVSGLRWDLVVAVGTVTAVRRSATSWRGELRLADGSRLPIGAGIAAAVPAARFAVGSRVAVTGIARPPATGSADGQLYEMLRGPADLVVLRDPSSGGAVAAAPAGVTRTAPPDEPLDADLADLPALLGRVVRVGGVIVAADVHQLTLDDGTAQATVRLPADAAASTPLPTGTAVTLVARVAAASGGGMQLELQAMADLALAGDPNGAQAPDADPAAATTATPVPAAQDDATTAEVDPGTSAVLGGAALGAAAALLLLLAGAVRRIRARLDGASRRRIRDRLVALGPPAAPEGPSGTPPGP